MAGFEILASGPFKRGELRIALCRELPAVRSAGDERLIESEWQSRLGAAGRSNTPLFNGSLRRLNGYSLESGTLVLSLGHTTYREYAGTRVPGYFAGRDRAALANPLAVCAAIVTADGRVVVGARHGVDVDNGLYDVPGGMVDLEDEDPFAAIQREIHEELGLEVEPGDLICTGLIYDLMHPHYELCFTGRTRLSFADLVGLHPTEREVAAVEGIAATPQGLSRFLKEKQGRMSPTGEACLVLYARLQGDSRRIMV